MLTEILTLHIIKSVDHDQLKHMLNRYLEYEMVRDNQALTGLNMLMVHRLFEKVRSGLKNPMLSVVTSLKTIF